ncbi:phosphoenolpyruvate--protein phosphotransferase, partial [Lachnospiraceae bacterium OttesenSCG-928-E19]|nr:phosphoenolpyruvate--protein phosphotransferase [Lachnospiraceae bacterium OttesenSCG-928-E19]
MKKINVPKTASKGYSIGPAYVVKSKEVTIDRAPIAAGQVETEIKRFEHAVEKAKEDLVVLSEESEIFGGHLALVCDIAVYDGVTGRIKNKLMNAETALLETQDEYCAIFESMEDEYMRERAADMKDVGKRLLYALKGIEDNPFAG